MSPGSSLDERVLLVMPTRTYRAGSFLAAAEKLGIQVTVGSDEQQVFETLNPAGLLNLDFDDPEESTSRIVEFADQYPIAAIVSVDDDGILLSAMASEALGIETNSFDSALAARNKHLMRERLAGAGIPSPGFALFPTSSPAQAVAAEVNYPCVIKPLFMSGSRGVIRADDESQFVQAFNRISAMLADPAIAQEGKRLAESVLVEDYIPGMEIAIEGLISDGSLRVLAIFDKPDPLEGPYFEETIYVTPTRHRDEEVHLATSVASRAAEAVGIRNGPVHAELRLNAEGAWLIEIAPRSIGGHCSRALRFGQECSLEEIILRQAVGLPVDHLVREKQAAGVMMIPIPGDGTLVEVIGLEAAAEVPGVDDVLLTLRIGAEVRPLPEGNRYLGFIFARGDEPEQVEAALRGSHAHLQIRLDPNIP